jgi:uncharacterized delta-60 repeat protein
MTASVKVSGVYKDTAPWAKVGGVWKRSKEAWTKVSGSWKQFFLAGGVYDSSFNTLDNSVSIEDQFNGTVSDIAIQADGKILAVGAFYHLYGASTGYLTRGLARINTDNTADISFSNNIGINFNSNTSTVAVQADQKIVVGGTFTTFAGVTVNRIVRLNTDGTRDTTFTTNTGTAFNGAVGDIAIQTDGKIVAVGAFTTFNGATVNRIARLNTDGSRDTTFTTNTGTAFSGDTSKVAIQSDGKILISGTFTTFNGVVVRNLVRLNTDGTRDTTFTTNLGTGFVGSTIAIAVQSDGKILVGGDLSSLNGTSINRFVRLNSDGTRDTSFSTNIGTALSSGGTVHEIAVQSDGKIVLTGFFPVFNGTTVNGIVRLNSDGTTDMSFASSTGIGLGVGASSTGRAILITPSSEIVVGGSFFKLNGLTVSYFFKLNSEGARVWPPTRLGTDGTVFSIAVQPDEKIILAGNFTAFNGSVVYHIIRINKNGTLDTSFNALLASSSSASNLINSVALQSDGKIIVGGDFTSFNGVSGRNRLVRLNTDGTVDTDFSTNIGTAIPSGDPDEEEVRCVAVQADNKIIIGGKFSTFNSVAAKNLIRLNSDGTRDTAFMANLGTGFTHSVFSGSDRVSAINVQSDNSILVAGQFNSLNGTVVRNIVKLNQDGTRQTSFTTNIGTGADQEILAVTTKPDGKIVIAGQFNAFNGHTISKVAQLQSSGARDTSFNPGSGTTSLLYAVAVQADNKILIGGGFSSFSGSSVKGFARLLENGSLDGGFNNESPMGQPTRSIRSIVIQPDKKILIGGDFRSEAKLLKNGVARIGSDLTA